MAPRRIRILIFTEGTILYHKSALDKARADIIRQVITHEKSVKNYSDYVPIGKAVEKISRWSSQNAEIIYLTSRRHSTEVNQIKEVLNRNNFVTGKVAFRMPDENYHNVAERIKPDILIEDDCESIGGKIEMTYPHIGPVLKPGIKSIVVKEFEGIDCLPNEINLLLKR